MVETALDGSACCSYPLPGRPLSAGQAQLDRNEGGIARWAMMYHALRRGFLSRATVVHVELVRKARGAASGLLRRPWTVRPRNARAAVSASYHAVRAALLHRRLSRLERLTAAVRPTPLVPLLTPHAAAVPTDQGSLK